MQLVLLNSDKLYPDPIKFTPSPQLLKTKASPLNCDLQHLSLLWPSLTTSTCCLYVCVCACVCVCVSIPCIVSVTHKEKLFRLSVSGSQLSFKAASFWVGPTHQTDFIVLTSRSKQTLLVLPWPKVSQRSLPLFTASAAAAAKSLQACPTLSDPMDCSPPGSSIHGIFQARVLVWGAIAFSISQLLLPSESLTIPLSIFHPCSNLLTLLLGKPPECS